MSSTASPFRTPATALFVVLLHLGAIAIAVRDFSRESPHGPVPREAILELLRIVPPAASTLETKARAHHRSLRRETPIPNVTLPHRATPADAAPEALHALLFDCSTDALAAASPEQRKRCLRLDQMPGDAAQALTPPSRTHDLPHWQRALARKENPPLLPCASPQGAGLSLGTLACIGEGLSGGFGDLDERPGYGDVRPDEVVIPNNGASRIPDPMPH